MCIGLSLCTNVVHNTAQNSSDNFPSYPPENHHSSDDVLWKGKGDNRQTNKGTTSPPASHLATFPFLFSMM